MREATLLVRRHLGLMASDVGVVRREVRLDPGLAVLERLLVVLGQWDQGRVGHGVPALSHVLDELVGQPLLLIDREA